MTEPYQRLLTLARLEHELALQGDFEGLERLDVERREIVSALPASPPPAVRAVLLEMAELQAATTAVLSEARNAVAAEMGEAERREQTARSYGRQVTPRSGTFTAAA